MDINTVALDPHLASRLEQEISKADQESGQLKKHVGQRAAGVYDEGAEPEGNVDSPDELHNSYHSSTVLLVKDLGAILEREFPGWAWSLQVNERGQMIELFNLNCHNKYAYRMRMRDLMFDPSRRVVRRGAAELLERFHLPRTGMTPAAAASLAEQPRDGHGNLIPDISDLADKKQKLNAEIARKVANGDIQIYEINGQKFARIKNEGTGRVNEEVLKK